MAGFIRRFTFDPGNEVINEIEGVVIIDREPPAQIVGVGSGMVTVVAELEDGPYKLPYQVASSSDFTGTFGGFGFTYDGVPSNNPCARSRKADNALVPEYWNGNGYIAVTSKRFAALNIVRVDTSVGVVEFRRLAVLTGANLFTFDLEPGQEVVFDAGTGGGTATAEFLATAPIITSAAGTFPSTFAGGEHFTFLVDGSSYTTVFEAADQTHAQCIARLNITIGYAAFADAGSDRTSFTGRQRGTGGTIQVVDQSTLVATALGFVVDAHVHGTGNVANIDAVTALEVNTIMVAAAAAASPAFVVCVERNANANLMLENRSTPLTGELNVTGCTATALGFYAGQVASAAVGVDGTIPAGTCVRDGSAHEWVTTQTVNVTVANAGPYSIRVRPALDDSTLGGAVAGAINVLPFPIPTVGMFSVINPLPVIAALTEAQLDAAYLDALDTTIDLSSIVQQTNIIISARQSNTIRSALRSNVINASGQGCYGRMTIIRPPLGTTTRAQAKSSTAQPGVGAYRHPRLIYAYPGVNVYVKSIGQRGAVGGPGFTNDGRIDVGFDAWIASTMSQLPPENNPGEETDYMALLLGIEQGNDDVQSMSIGDYTAFKAVGIAAPIMANGLMTLQSGITSVNPLLQPNLKNINRQRMADFITDSLSLRCVHYSKTLATRVRRALVASEIDAFLSTLRGDTNPASQRIVDYSIDSTSANTPEQLAGGQYRLIIKVRTLSSMDDIVLDCTIGESVTFAAA